MLVYPAQRQRSRVGLCVGDARLGGGFDRDLVAEGFELVDVGPFAAFRVVALVVEVRAEVGSPMRFSATPAGVKNSPVRRIRRLAGKTPE
jgi:hypothetical protein